MDEFNLASRFASEEDEPPRRSRGKLKRLRRGRTGVGLEKPEDLPLEPGEEKEDLGPELGDEGPAFDSEVSDVGADEEDDAFRDLLDRMEGESASAGRASARRAKLKGRRPAPRRFEDEEE